MFLGLRTAIYHTPDIAKAKTWYSRILGIEPYYDQPYYVGFTVAGYELGLDPAPAKAGENVGVYWGVTAIDAVYQKLLEFGATPHQAVQDVGDGIKVATVLDPFGNVFGIIENPHFKLPV